MPFRFRRRETVADGTRRIVREEMLKAIAAARDEGRSTNDRVHDVRTSCKKIRGTLRLVRPLLKQSYRQENAWFRDQARSLASLRDAMVIIGQFDDVAGKLDADRVDTAALRAKLERELPRSDQADARDRLRTAADAFQVRLVEVDSWSIDEKGSFPLGKGLAAVYRRGLKAMRKAVQSADTGDWHDWRKQVKYHWYHVRLLGNLWKPLMQVRRDELDRLSDLLGLEHDLTILAEKVATIDDADDDARRLLLEQIDEQRQLLRSTAVPIGKRLYAEPPRAIRKRFRRYWNIWRKDC